MLQRSTIQLLRFHFALFLMPVYFFAVSQTVYTNWWRAILVFIILHGLVYPASNGYNSYMDCDQGPVGGIRKPMQPTEELRKVVLVMDGLALLLSISISVWFAGGVLFYIMASRAYSNRGLRIKKYPVIGYLLVICCQGALVFWLVYHGVHAMLSLSVPVTGMIASSLLIGGAYPLTQVYQHEADRSDGVTTISMLLGVKGSFRFSAIVFNIAFLVLGVHFALQLELDRFFVLLLFFLPVGAFFLYWARKVWKDTATADFDHLMKMNLVAAICSNLGFLALLIWKLFD